MRLGESPKAIVGLEVGLQPLELIRGSTEKSPSFAKPSFCLNALNSEDVQLVPLVFGNGPLL